MNWNDLIKWIESLTPEQRETNVSVYDATNDETYPVTDFDITVISDTLDSDHPIITFN